jgi:glutaredoxin
MIELYILNGCPYCIMAVDMLKKKKIDYKSIVVSYDKKEEYKKLHKMETFPQIFIKKGQKKIKIGGLSELTKYFETIDNLKKNNIKINILDEIYKL